MSGVSLPEDRPRTRFPPAPG